MLTYVRPESLRGPQRHRPTASQGRENVPSREVKSFPVLKEEEEEGEGGRNQKFVWDQTLIEIGDQAKKERGDCKQQ